MSLEDNNRIAKNTTVLYIRMFIGMAVSLYTSRVILEVLGVENFGVYNIVGGIVSLFSFLNASMSGATSRFITFELGRGNEIGLKSIFNSAMLIHILIALIVVIICETFGIWLLLSKLEIPPESRTAAMWVFQCSIISMAVGVTQIPYTACVIAHEKMGAFAYIDLLSTFLKLGIVYLLVIFPENKLQVYGVLVLIFSTSIAFIYRLYCIKNFKECRLSFKSVSRTDMKAMLSFSGWDVFASISSIGRTQGVAILANIFFGAVANAAIGIANQVQGAVNAFATNITIALKPQIIKSYASGEYSRMQSLIYFGCKIVFILLLFIITPLIIEMPYVLEVWLKTVPQYTINIARMTLLFILFSNISIVTVTGVYATGDTRPFGMLNGSLYISVVPITYVAYRLQYPIFIPFILNIVFVILGGTANFYYVTRYVKSFSMPNFVMNVVLRCIIIAVICIFPIYILHRYISSEAFLSLCYTIACSSLLIPFIGFYGLFNKEERTRLKRLVGNIKSNKGNDKSCS